MKKQLKNKKRAPRGYRIEKRADGFYHVYWMHDNLMDCINTCLTHDAAIKIANIHKKVSTRTE